MSHDHSIARHGLTLVELLCALALLGLLMGGLSAWLTIAIRDTPAVRARLQFESAAQAAVQRIAEDLLSGDFESTELDGERQIVIDEVSLTVTTRSLDRVTHTDQLTHEYRLEDDRLIIVESSAGGAGEPRRRTLLRNIAQLRFELRSDRDAIESEGILHVEIHSSEGQQFIRTVRWLR